METKAKVYDADGRWTGEYVVRTPEQQAEHERKVAAYRAEVAARPAQSWDRRSRLRRDR